MDFGVLFSDDRTIIYKRGTGIVLNEPTCIVYTVGEKNKKEIKTIAVGKAATRHNANGIEALTVASLNPIKKGRVVDTTLAGLCFSELFKKVSGSISIRRGCLFCIPCSLDATELDALKTATYSSGASDVEFVPSVIASAVALGADLHGTTPIISVIMEDYGVEIAIIKRGEILAGGTLAGIGGERPVNKLIVDTIAGLSKKIEPLVVGEISTSGVIYFGGKNANSNGAKEYFAGSFNIPTVCDERSFNSIINGAGKLLDDPQLVKKIIRLN